MKKKIRRPEKTAPPGKAIFLVAEGTGETITKITNAALAQFSKNTIVVQNFFQVATKAQIRQVVKEAVKQEALVAFSIVAPALGDYLLKEAARNEIKAIDVIGDFIFQLSAYLEQQPKKIPGAQHILDEAYYRRIEAINFAVKHDDGKTPQGLGTADFVLIGLSRTGKTPLSTYLAHQGWKVANVPLYPDLEPPAELFEIEPHKVFGLIINVENLVRVREARLTQLGLSSDAKYADPIKIADEIEWCEGFYARHPQWQVVDISNKAIEEAAVSIVTAFQRAGGS
ncbi:MAG: kinase/pyrophosphorylase [Deltaproteobacteria bacterium]|nr:kinase/pyrophosphorylase [Deltaproteobacteria bacterium]